MALELDKMEYDRDNGVWMGWFSMRDEKGREIFSIRERAQGGTIGNDHGYMQELSASKALERLFKSAKNTISNAAKDI